MSVECACFGALGRDGEQKVSKSGTPYLLLNVRVADGDTAQWISVLGFDEHALEQAGKFIRGARVYVEGRLSTNEWTAPDGGKRLGLSIMSWHCRLAQIGRNKPKRENVSVAGGGQLHPTRSAAANDFHNDDIGF